MIGGKPTKFTQPKIKHTFTLLMGLADMKMFLLSRSRDTTTGSTKNSEEEISALTEGGADAVRAIKGNLPALVVLPTV